MSLTKVPTILSANFFHACSFTNKKEGIIILKSDVFAPVFSVLQPKMDQLLDELSAALKPLYLANKDKIVVDAKPGRRKPKIVDDDLVSEGEDPGSDADDEEPIQRRPVRKVTNIADKIQAASKRRTGKKGK